MKPRILIVDDDESIQGLLKTRLLTLGYEVQCGSDAADLRKALHAGEFQAVLLDYQLPDGDGISLLTEIHEWEPHLPVIIITAHGNVETAVRAMRNGAYDFSPKPIDFNRLEVSVKNAVEHYHLKTRVTTLERTRRSDFCGMIGGSVEMQVIYHMIETVASTRASILITGESGTGKELVACAIHDLSSRHANPMIDVNCAAIPKELLESELFGHEKAAFTGAAERSIGRFEQAHNSTLFLDEISEMNYSLQAKLLRFLQERSFYRVGGKQKVEVDVRILSATNRSPLEAIEKNMLREDLYYRLNVVNIHLPPLRKRVEDIPALAEYFLDRYAKENEKTFQNIAPETMDLFCAYAWPGNVRELENGIQQSVILYDGPTLQISMLPGPIRQVQAEKGAAISSNTGDSPTAKEPENEEIIPLDILERRAIENALRRTGGNVSKTAIGLNISQATLYRKIREYGLQMKDFK